jgi:hypothetical protein
MAKTVPLDLRTHWVNSLNRPCEGFDPYLALVVTLATTLEHLDLQYPKGGDVTSICMVLHYYQTVEEVAINSPYTFLKLKKLDLRAETFPEDCGSTMVNWVPLPSTHGAS